MSQQRVKQSVVANVAVFLKDTAGVAVTGVAYTAVTCYLTKNAGTPAAKTMSGANWTELDAVHMPGWYNLSLSTTDTNTVGTLGFCVIATGAKNFQDILEVGASLIDDLGTLITRALGMLHENSYMDNIVFDGSNNLVAYRLRLYDTKAHASTPPRTAGLIATYAMTATFVGANLQSYQVTLEP